MTKLIYLSQNRQKINIAVNRYFFRTCHNSSLKNKSEIKDYEDIPIPPGGQLPFVGHTGLFIKKPAGYEKSWKNILELKNKHVPPGVELLRLKIPLSNVGGAGRVLVVFDPADIQEVYRNEGKYPHRGPGFECFKAVRVRRKDLYGQTTGLLTEEGQDWQKIRSQVQQDMMRPKSAMYYVDKLQEIGDDLVAFIRRERNKANLTISDFLKPAHRFALESITVIAVDTRLGCFDSKIPPNVQTFLKATDGIMKTFPGMLTKFPIWNYIPPRWSPLFREVEDHNNIASDFVKEKLEEALNKFKSRGENESDDVSIMEKLLRRNGPHSEITQVMALDMMQAGIDTTGNTLAFIIYNLSKNPDKQELLRKEIQSFGHKNLTAQDVGKMKYFRACQKESFRVTPTIPYISRLVPNEMILRNYKIPAKTLVMWCPTLLGKNEEYFSNPEQYLPERWLDKNDEIHPFTIRQFSHGPRMCIGKRFAELEIQLGVCKLIQNFEISWEGSEDMELVTELINTPDRPMPIKFSDIS